MKEIEVCNEQHYKLPSLSCAFISCL